MIIDETTISGFRPGLDAKPINWIGRTLGHYRILEKLGEGGMGEVYLAEDTQLGRQVAIKLLPPSVAARANSLQRFAREASAVGALNHPNIVTIHGLEEAEGQRLIVMELVAGQTLSGLVPETGLSPERFLAIALPLAEAVAAAHARGVIHRDIKPANIMVNDEGRVKVVDFGLAKLRPDLVERSGIAQPTLTREGHMVGTVTYMSPEQLRGEPADARSDVFSLGTVLYEMATGRHPFDGDTQPVVISSILCQDPARVTSVREQFPARLDHIIRQCLTKEPTERFADAGALHRELLALKQSLDEERILATARIGIGGNLRTIAFAGLAVVAIAVALIVALRPTPPREIPVADGMPRTMAGPVVETSATASAPAVAVAVLHFHNRREDPELDWLRTGLADMLITDLSQSGAFRVLTGEQTYDTLRDLERLDDLGDRVTEVVQAMAERAGVTAVVSGSFVRIGDNYQISYKLHDTASGEILETDRISDEGESSLFAMVDQLSRAVRTRLEVAGSGRFGDRDLDAVTTASVEAYRYYVEGRNFRRRAKLQEAVPMLEKAVELDPGFAMAWARLAVVQRALGRAADARRSAGRAVAHAERLPERERHFVEGQFYSDERATYAQAFDALGKALEVDPDHATARYTLGSMYSFLERGDDAIEQLEILRRQPTEIAGLDLFLAHTHATRDAEDRALDVLRAACDRDPDSWWNHLVLGWYEANFLRFEDARATLARAESLRPGASHLTKARWDLAILQRDWAEAERQARAGMDAADTFGRTNGHFEMAWLRLYQGRVDDAIPLFLTDPDPGADDRRAAALRARHAADLLLQFGRAAEAAELAALAIRDDPGDWSGREGLILAALAAEALGRSHDADRHAARFHQLVEPHLSQVEVRYAHHLDGRLALARGEPTRARRHLADAEALLLPRGIDWKVVPDHVAIWWSLAVAAEQAGDDDQAIFWFRRIADSTTEHLRDPVRYVRSWYRLGRHYARRGDVGLAHQAFEAFLAFWGEGTADRPAVDEARQFVDQRPSGS